MVQAGEGVCAAALGASPAVAQTPAAVTPAAITEGDSIFHSKGNCSITGGVVVRDKGLSALRGRYVFGDFCRGRIETAKLSPGHARSVRQTRL